MPWRGQHMQTGNVYWTQNREVPGDLCKGFCGILEVQADRGGLVNDSILKEYKE